MKDKNLIWIIPLLFILGFGTGYISGLHIPEKVTFSFDNATLETINKMSYVQELRYGSESKLECNNSIDNQSITFYPYEFNEYTIINSHNCGRDMNYTLVKKNATGWFADRGFITVYECVHGK